MQSIDKQGNDMQSGGVQCMAVLPLGELKSRPKWCTVESRVENVGGRRGKGNGRSQAALQTARGGFRGGQVRVDLDPSGGGEALMARQVRRRSWPSESVRLHRLVPESTTSNSSHPSWLTQPLSPRVTSEITPSTIFHPRQPFPDRLLRHPQNLVIVELFSSPILFATGIHLLPVLPPHPKLPQGLP
jgi:hypothetical protein